MCISKLSFPWFSDSLVVCLTIIRNYYSSACIHGLDRSAGTMGVTQSPRPCFFFFFFKKHIIRGVILLWKYETAVIKTAFLREQRFWNFKLLFEWRRLLHGNLQWYVSNILFSFTFTNLGEMDGDSESISKICHIQTEATSQTDSHSHTPSQPEPANQPTGASQPEPANQPTGASQPTSQPASLQTSSQPG